MLEDETEPSLFYNFDYNFSSSSSSVFFDEEMSNYLARRTSVSLYNISSTPYGNRIKNVFSRSRSHAAAAANNTDKTKKENNKYDHVESKVKKYINDIKQQQADCRKRKQIEEENIHLENERRYLSDIHDIENENINKAVSVPADQYKDLFEQHKKALGVIESQRMEILRMKSNGANNVEKETLLQGVLKGNLFENSMYSTINTRKSVAGLNSTCITEDIFDSASELRPYRDDVPHAFTIPASDPFMIHSQNKSLSMSFHSDTPLLLNRQRCCHHRKSHIKFMKIFSCCKLFKNKYKIKPEIIITTPSTKSDSGHQSDLPSFKAKSSVSIKCNPKTEPDLLLQQLITCADELTSKLLSFKKVAEQFENNNK